MIYSKAWMRRGVVLAVVEGAQDQRC